MPFQKATPKKKEYKYYCADIKHIDRFKLEGYEDFNATKEERKKYLPIECLNSHRLMRKEVT